METIVNQKKKSIASVISMYIAIALSFATLTYLADMYTPALSFTGGILGFRLSSILKPFCLVTPMAPIGIALGNAWANEAVGKVPTLVHQIVPAINVLMGLACYKLFKLGTQNGWKFHVKNLLMLTVFGIIAAFVIRIDVTITKFGMLTAIGAQAFFWKLMFFKILSMTIPILAGYPLVLSFLKIKNK